MIDKCIKCDTKIHERVHLGYRECVECSSKEALNSAHIVYPHKTEVHVQPISQETKNNLDRLDRKARSGWW